MNPTSHRFSFPKAEHLKSRKAIEELFNIGKHFFVRPYKVFYTLHNIETSNGIQPIEKPAFPCQAGFAVSSKNFGHAVDRNRVKRISREAYRLQKQMLLQTLHEKNRTMQVFFVYTDKVLPKYAEAEEKMKACLLKLSNLI